MQPFVSLLPEIGPVPRLFRTVILRIKVEQTGHKRIVYTLIITVSRGKTQLYTIVEHVRRQGDPSISTTRTSQWVLLTPKASVFPSMTRTSEPTQTPVLSSQDLL